MRRYKIVFEVLAPNGWWHDDEITNNGKGFSYENAEHIANQLRTSSDNGIQHDNVRVVEI